MERDDLLNVSGGGETSGSSWDDLMSDDGCSTDSMEEDLLPIMDESTLARHCQYAALNVGCAGTVDESPMVSSPRKVAPCSHGYYKPPAPIGHLPGLMPISPFPAAKAGWFKSPPRGPLPLAYRFTMIDTSRSYIRVRTAVPKDHPRPAGTKRKRSSSHSPPSSSTWGAPPHMLRFSSVPGHPLHLEPPQLIPPPPSIERPLAVQVNHANGNPVPQSTAPPVHLEVQQELEIEDLLHLEGLIETKLSVQAQEQLRLHPPRFDPVLVSAYIKRGLSSLAPKDPSSSSSTRPCASRSGSLSETLAGPLTLTLSSPTFYPDVDPDGYEHEAVPEAPSKRTKKNPNAAGRWG